MKNIFSILLMTTMIGCSAFSTKEESAQPIENPFGDFYNAAKASKSPMIFRTKKGDRSIEVEIPESDKDITDVIMPMNPDFNEMNSSGRNVASNTQYDYTYDERKPTIADREIEQTFPKGNPNDEWKRREIENGLGLAPTQDETPDSDGSYLAKIDKVKQLYNMGRFEAALLEVDPMIRQYPTNPKLYEMRGTVLQKLGYQDLAIKAWGQALEFNPSNIGLKKFVDRQKYVQSRKLASP
ncbi:MAG: hypothetical protein KA715_12855 [Xanthomonadaceae bacterium]|nr:hypothetical protein [Xanthomonadaceae bacterium]